MIIYTVFDASDGIELAFPTRNEAIATARECTPGTDVERIDIGALTRARACALYNREKYAVSSTLIYTTPDEGM